MGMNLKGESQIKRLSGYAYALGITRETVRFGFQTASIFILGVLLFYCLWYGTTVKNVTLIVNGQEMAVQTHRTTLKQLLEDENVALSPHDKVTKPLNDPLVHGETIVIERAFPIQVTADGQTRTLFTIGKTVGDALNELQIPLGEHDKVTPALTAPIAADDAIRIVRVQKETEEIKEAIPYRIVKKEDPNLLKGKEKTVREGSEGVLARRIEKVYEDGKLVAQKVIGETVLSKSVDKVVAVGTKAPVAILSASSPDVKTVTKNGVTFRVKKILDNVTVTAYSAGYTSTGKTKDHPQYGITYTGTKVKEGRTAAVDPKVIPLGWWIYIEGFGFRRAEDIGSGVKGKHVDIYFDNGKYADRFGTKKGYTVYVIGPTKPAAD